MGSGFPLSLQRSPVKRRGPQRSKGRLQQAPLPLRPPHIRDPLLGSTFHLPSESWGSERRSGVKISFASAPVKTRPKAEALNRMELRGRFLLVFLQGPVTQVQAPPCARRCPGPGGQNEEPGRTGLSLWKRVPCQEKRKETSPWSFLPCSQEVAGARATCPSCLPCPPLRRE